MYNIPYQLVIDTDSYAGNFERELCAYCTGHWDNETHGDYEAGLFEEEVGDPEEIFDTIAYTATEDDDVPIIACQCLEVEPSTNQYNSVAIFFDTEPTKEQIDLIKQRAQKYAESATTFGVPMNILGFRLMHRIEQISEVAV